MARTNPTTLGRGRNVRRQRRRQESMLQRQRPATTRRAPLAAGRIADTITEVKVRSQKGLRGPKEVSGLRGRIEVAETATSPPEDLRLNNGRLHSLVHSSEHSRDKKIWYRKEAIVTLLYVRINV